MAPFLISLQESRLALWVSGSTSLLGYPAILTLHTIGLALLVGAGLVVDLRLLGAGRDTPPRVLAPLFPIMWTGLAINIVTGVLLFIADAVRKAGQPVFLIKLLCVAGAVGALVMIRSMVLRQRSTGSALPRARARALAMASLALWAAAIVAGRLVAYL